MQSSSDERASAEGPDIAGILQAGKMSAEVEIYSVKDLAWQSNQYSVNLDSKNDTSGQAHVTITKFDCRTDASA